jgi:nicotinamidase-related amidase
MVTTVSMTQSLSARSAEYIDYIEDWLRNRPELALSEIIDSAGGPDRVAVVSVDLIVGFCHAGPLASQRVAGVLPAVRDLFQRCWDAGIRQFVLTQDTHLENAEEFNSYPPHCVAGTQESQTVPELTSLPFSNEFRVIEKNSISSLTAPAFSQWEQSLAQPPKAWIVVGDCTDLCIYQAAMALKLRSVSEGRGERVILPENCVQTYDLPVSVARDLGVQPHDGDLLHHVFLHSMTQNGIEVVARIV